MVSTNVSKNQLSSIQVKFQVTCRLESENLQLNAVQGTHGAAVRQPLSCFYLTTRLPISWKNPASVEVRRPAYRFDHSGKQGREAGSPYIVDRLGGHGPGQLLLL
jgi:hypothetical protein